MSFDAKHESDNGGKGSGGQCADAKASGGNGPLYNLRNTASRRSSKFGRKSGGGKKTGSSSSSGEGGGSARVPFRPTGWSFRGGVSSDRALTRLGSRQLQ